MLRAQNIGEIDTGIMLQGIDDTLSDREPKIDDTQMRAAMKKHFAEVEAKRAESAAKNSTEGATFREQNGKRDNVVTLESGLQYEVLEPGDGASPQAGDTVEVHYHGTLIDGTVFDSSRQRGKPANFGLDKVVPGFKEALSLMKPGAKWKIVMPPELAYGERGAGKQIGPNETLIFELELLKITTKSDTAKK